jgi:hypothetical protein
VADQHRGEREAWEEGERDEREQEWHVS